MVKYKPAIAAQPIAPGQPLVVAVPQLHTYPVHSGIGRVFHSLCAEWGEQVRLVEADFAASRLPLLRNFPTDVRAPARTNLILLPKLTGAQALRSTGGIPSLVVVHDIGVIDFPGDREGMDWFTYRTVMQSLRGLRYARRVVAVSRFCRDRLVAHLPALADRVSVVPNGVNAAFLEHRSTRNESRQRIEQRIGRRLGTPLLLNVGTELPRKNMPLLLGVFKQVKASHPAAQLIKVGAAGQPRWRMPTLAAIQKLDLSMGNEVVILEDGVDDRLLADLYKAADVFVSTSLYEGFGLPALEAMAIGTPVVVTNCGAFPEVVGDAGWVVEPALEPFVRAVKEALTSSQREEQGSRGKRCAAAYTWTQSAAHYLELLHATARTSAENPLISAHRGEMSQAISKD